MFINIVHFNLRELIGGKQNKFPFKYTMLASSAWSSGALLVSVSPLCPVKHILEQQRIAITCAHHWRCLRSDKIKDGSNN